MGCGLSKLEDEESNNLPADLKASGGRIDDIMQKKRVRDVRIVSRSEAPKPEDREATEEALLTKGTEKANAIKRDADRTESPSFRIYFRESASFARDSDDDSGNLVEKIKEAKLSQEKDAKLAQMKEQKESAKTHGRVNSKDSNSTEESSITKPSKKKFKGLGKAPSHVYNSLLAIKNS